MSVNKYVQVNQNALIEFIHEENSDTLYRDFNYKVITNNRTNEVYFVLDESSALNIEKNQLFVIDSSIRKYGILNPDTYSFLSVKKFFGNSPSQYMKIKIWFPINYNFIDSVGFYLNVHALDYENNKKYDLTNFFLDTSDVNMMSNIHLEDEAFRMNNKLWGKSITLYIPNIDYQSKQRVDNKAQIGSINYNLAGNLGLSTTAPIYVDFRFLKKKRNVLNEITYSTTTPLLFTTPQSPPNLNLSVSIKSADDGDYFIINGKYNGSQSELAKYMEMRTMSGNNSYILYSITLYEDNIPQSTRDIYVYDNYIEGINDYRPVIKYTNTSASIRVDMKLISNVDNSIEIKTANYELSGNEVAKYGKSLTSINVNNVIKPKLYNSAPTQINLPTRDVINSYFKRKATKKLELRYIPYPVLYDSANIAIKDLLDNNTNIYGPNRLILNLRPFDNVFKFNVLDYKDTSNYKSYEIPVEDTIVNMVFKSESLSVRIPLYDESAENDLKNGVLVFKINETDLKNIKKINSTSNFWYITLTTNGIETVLYQGMYHLNVLDVQIKKPILSPAINFANTLSTINNQLPLTVTKFNTLNLDVLKPTMTQIKKKFNL